MNKIDFLGEDNFLEVMETENLHWQNTCTTQGQFSSFDGTKLNFYYAIPKSPKAAIAIFHGFCEFWAKYHEYAWYLYQAGYAIFILEQRGHGYSEGKNDEHDVVYIDNYDTYVEDYKQFLDLIVVPKSAGLNLILLAHSMGGAVATLFLEKYPEYFCAAILNSPMLKMKKKTSPILINLLSIYSTIFKRHRKIAPGQRRFNHIPTYETSSTMSKPRYDYLFEKRKQDWHYQTYGASISWALASFKATDKLMKHASSIKIPVTLFTAGQDHLIDPEGYAEFAKRVPHAEIHNFEESRHEIFNADEAIRRQYYEQVLLTLEKYSAN